MSGKARFLITVIVLGLGVFGAWYFGFIGGEKRLSFEGISTTFDSTASYTGEFSETVTYQPPAVETLSPLSKKYENAEHYFSFRYPEDFTLSEFAEPISETEDRDTVLVQNVEKKEGFQVLISAFDETGAVLTAERIKQDLPDLEMRDVQEVLLGTAGKGVAFLSNNEAFGGASREVWFIIAGRLFQVSTYASQEKILQAVLQTWEFK